jgi:sugar phosphate isomerase/epimerase
MASADLATAARRHRALDISILDLKDGIFGRAVEDLSADDAALAARVIREEGCSVYCLSSCIGYTDLAEGEALYTERHLGAMRRLTITAHALQPRAIRLLAPRVPPGLSFAACMEYFPWTIAVYRQLIDLADVAGFDVLLENEAHDCLLASADDCLAFVTGINRPRRLKLIYDVQNLWQMGEFPSVGAVRKLGPILGGLHLKGGQSETGTALALASPLATASWPVRDVTRAALDLGTVPVICVNPSHGRWPPGYDTWDVALQDLRFLRTHFTEIHGHALPA